MPHTSYRQALRAHRGLWISAALLLMVMLIISLLPIVMEYAIPRALRNAGIDQASVGNVDFNPFTGRFRLQDLDARIQGVPVLRLAEVELDIAWWPLLKRQIHIQQIDLSSGSVLIEELGDGRMRAAGFIAGEGEAGTEPGGVGWSFGSDRTQLQDLVLRLHMPQLTLELQLDAVTLSPLYSWRADQAGDLKLRGRLNGTPLELQFHATPFAEPARYQGELKLQGLDIALARGFLPDSIAGLAGRLFVDTRLDLQLHPAGPRELAQDGSLRVDDLRLGTAGLELQQGELRWAGHMQVSQTDSSSPSIALDGELQGKALHGALAEQNLVADLGQWQWQGGVQIEPEAQGLAVKAAGQAALDDTRLQRLDNTQPLVAVANLKLTDLNLAELTDLSAASLQLAGLELGAAPGQEAAPVTLAGLALSDLHWQQVQGISLASVVLDDLRATLLRDADGQMPLLAAWQGVGAAPGSAAEPAPAAETKAPMPLRIDKLQIAKGSWLAFRDASVKPAFSTRLTLDKALLGPLDNGAPEQPAKLELTASTGEYSRLDFQGDVRPFLPQPKLDLEGRLRSVDLPVLSAYTRKALGYDISSGSLDADVELHIAAGAIDAQNQLTLRNLQMKAANAGKAEQLQQKLSMPLDTALSMLRDRDNHIRIKLPVSGDLQDPQFELGDIIQTALAKATQKAAVSYLKYALQPYGAILSVVQMAGKAGSALQLDPIRFAAGEEVAAGDSLDYLGKIHELLQQRPQLELRLCGRAVEADRPALAARQTPPQTKPAPGQAAPPAVPPAIPDETLLALAGARAAQLKERLVSDYGVAPERLYLCNPELDPEPGAEPRVDILI